MACIPMDQWQAAVAACKAQSNPYQSVKGFRGFGADYGPQISALNLQSPGVSAPNPCDLAAQTPCSNIRALPGAIKIVRPSETVTTTATMTPTPTSGNLRMVGILALIVVGGVVIYQVSKKKA